MKNTKQLAGLLVLGLTSVGFNAMGIQISYGDYGVGHWTPASGFNSDPVIAIGVQHSVDIWNGDEAAGLFNYSESGPPPVNESATFTKGAGSTLPLVLPDVIDYFSRDESSPYQVDNTAGLYTYLTAKYGNSQQQVFFIANVHDIITVPTSVAGVTGGLSHLAWLTAERVPQVPDGGTTLMLLGAGLAGLAAVRRKLGI